MDSPINANLPTTEQSIMQLLGVGATEQEKSLVRFAAANGTQLTVEWVKATTDQERDAIERQWYVIKSTLLNLGEARAQVVSDRLEAVLLRFLTALEGAGITALFKLIPVVG